MNDNTLAYIPGMLGARLNKSVWIRSTFHILSDVFVLLDQRMYSSLGTLQ